MEKQLIISLDEYNKLKAENKRMKEILEGKEKIVGIQSVLKPSCIGYYTDSWNVLLETNLIAPMAVRIHELENKNWDLTIELRKIKDEANRASAKQSWWQKPIF